MMMVMDLLSVRAEVLIGLVKWILLEKEIVMIQMNLPFPGAAELTSETECLRDATGSGVKVDRMDMPIVVMVIVCIPTSKTSKMGLQWILSK